MFVLSGCSTNKGYIVQKYIKPSYTTFSYIVVNKVTVPYTVVHPTEYIIVVKVCDENDRCENDNVSVSEKQYNEYWLGEWYDGTQ